MRKILLATTALIGFAAAGAAQAATAPLNVTVGGSVEFAAGAFHESRASGATNSSSGDFETIYSLAFGVEGKAANGITYGGNLVLDNDINQNTLSYDEPSNGVRVTKASVFMSGAYGKLQLGDARGATDLAVVAPNLGGIRYIDFLSNKYVKELVGYIDRIDHSTNVTYYTPKFGNDAHKVQAAVTYTPNYARFGSDVQLTKSNGYRNVVKGALAYTGNFKPVAVKASADIISGVIHSSSYRDFTAWDVGAEAAYSGFTLGANYSNLGRYLTIIGQNKEQQTFGAGLTYQFCCALSAGINYLGGEGYSTLMGGWGGYVKEFNNYSFASTYTWAPGLTTTGNVVLFDEKAATGVKNDGYVLLISQKLAF